MADDPRRSDATNPATAALNWLLQAAKLAWPDGCGAPDECRQTGFCERTLCPHGAGLVLPGETLASMGRYLQRAATKETT